MNEMLRIAFPPEGMTARRLLMNFLAQLAMRIDISLQNGYAVIEAPSKEDMAEEIRYCLRNAGEMLRNSLMREERRLRDFPMHRNDRGWAANLGVTGMRFCEAVWTVLSDPNFTWNQLEDLSEIDVSPRRVQLGSAEAMAIPQSFLYERYKARYEFLRGRGGGKIDFRASKAWMYVLFAGFAFGYCGCFDNEIIIAFLPEVTLLRLLGDEGLRNMLAQATDGLIPTFKELESLMYSFGSFARINLSR